MKIIIKSNPRHASQLASRLDAGSSAAAAESTETRFLDFEVEKLNVSFDELDFAVNTADAEKRKSCALSSFTQMLIPDEQLVSHRFGATITTAGNIHLGCPVLEAKTNLAEYVVVYDDFIITNGTVKNNLAAYGNYRQGHTLLQGGIAMYFTKAFGKALGRLAATELFHKFFPEDNDAVLREELGKLKTEIKQMLQETRYENLEDKLLQTTAWLRDTYSEKLKAHNNRQTVNTEELRTDLKNRQEELHGIAEVIQQRITPAELAACEYLTRARVILFSACAALRVVLMREQIFWQNAMRAQGNKNYENDADLNELKTYVAKVIKKLKDFTEGLKNGRLGKISAFDYTRHKAQRPNKSAVCYTHWVSMRWTDTFTSSNKNDPFRGEKIESVRKVNTDDKDNNVDQVRANVEKEYNDHVAAVKGLFAEYFENPVNEVVNNLENMKYVIE